MDYTLMHQDIPVLVADIETETGEIRKIRSVIDPGHMPVAVCQKNENRQLQNLRDWWEDRKIQKDRPGFGEAMVRLGVESPLQLSLRAYGLSLTDRYWIRPDGADLEWDRVNFFSNPFSPDVGNILFGEPPINDPVDYLSPDCTTNAFLQKRWEIHDGKRYLVKGGTLSWQQEPFSEAVASRILDALRLPHVTYSLVWRDNVPYSVCENFLTEHLEYVPAWHVAAVEKRSNSKSLYQHLTDCCGNLGIRDIGPFLDMMLTVDYIIANQDRHLNNFGLLRDADSSVCVSPAPLFDNGNSLFYDSEDEGIRSSGASAKSLPFQPKHARQIGLVTDFSWLDFSALYDVEDIIMEEGSGYMDRGLMSESRVKAIADAVRHRVETLEKIAEEKGAGS